MNLKSAKCALSKLGIAVISISLFAARTEAQIIGHLGVSADPIPLAQAKRPQPKYLARNINRNRPDPSSPNLRADVSGVGGATGQNAKPLSSTPTPSSPVVVAENKPKPSAPASAPAVGAKPSLAVSKPVPAPMVPTFDDHLAKAADLAVKGDARAAADAFRAALALKPDSIEAHLGLADALFDAKNYQGADAEYQQIIAQNPTSPEARRGRADTFYELNKYEDAVGEYQAALQAGASDAGVFNNYANALFRTGKRENRDRAIENYRKAIEKDANLSDPYAGLAYALRVQNRLPDARQAVETSIRLNPKSSLAHTVAGRVYADLKDFARANVEAQESLKLAPKDPFVYVNWAGVLFAQQRYNEAISAYTAAQSYDRTWALPYNSLGNLYLSIGRPAYALEEFQKADGLEPKNSIIHDNLGTTLLALQKLDAAVENYRLAVQLDERNSSAYYNLGAALNRQGRTEDSINAFRQAFKLEPENAKFREALAGALKKAGRGKEAKEIERGSESSEKDKKKKKGE